MYILYISYRKYINILFFYVIYIAKDFILTTLKAIFPQYFDIFAP